MRGNAPRYTCKSNRVYLCNRSRGTIESIAVFKVTFVDVMSFIRRGDSNACATASRVLRSAEKSEFPINIHPGDNAPGKRGTTSRRRCRGSVFRASRRPVHRQFRFHRSFRTPVDLLPLQILRIID